MNNEAMNNEKGPETWPGLSKRNTEGRSFRLPRFSQPIYLDFEIISQRVSQSPSAVYLDDNYRADDEADYDSNQHVIHVIL